MSDPEQSMASTVGAPAGCAGQPDWPEPAMTVDARGLRCPEPLMVLRDRIRRLAAGELIRIDATDPSTERDFRDFCRYLDHELVESAAVDGNYAFLIRKGGA